MPLIRILLVLRGRTAYAAHPSKRLSPGLLKGSGGSVGSARALPGLYQGSPKRPFGLRIMGTTVSAPGPQVESLKRIIAHVELRAGDL